MSVQLSDRILIVDDDIQIRRALHRALSGSGYPVAVAASGEEALESAAADPPAMIILDLSLPGKSGLDVCRELRGWSKAPILVLSARDRDSDKIAALDLGADDYMTKPFSTEELLARIRAHFRRSKEEMAPSQTVVETGDLKIDFTRRQVFVEGKEIKLTKTEYAFLQYLVQNAGRVVTYSQILNKVWGSEYQGDLQTLRVHAGNLRRKIEPDPARPRHILTEAGVGYRFAKEI